MKKTEIIFLVLLGAMLTGCFSPSAMDVAVVDENAPLVGLYRLRALDPLRIEMLGIPEEKALDTSIDERGNITIPYIFEPIRVAGMSTSELEREIQKIYTENEIYRNITINVQTLAKIYYLEGEVQRPQEYPLNRRITLLQAIAAASGYTEYANKKNVTITRNGKVTKFNAKDIEKHPELDVPIEAGDRIKVNRTFY